MAENIRIVEYEPRYAKSIADMWNLSGDSWGGDGTIRTEDSVRQEHENSTNLHVFLAVDGEEVVGYCSFSHYRNDEGALYVPLLNVRPDYHGKKVGKSLVLKAVETTVRMGWPRLDLFTWAGNTKAVPMYKKCGFFWEKRENSTHLMNFIPTVLRTEALKPYFERLDWYADGRRNLEIKPDGRRENGFDLFEYRWEKDGLNLRVEFEKTGRGLRLIETDDYLIYAAVDDHKLVFGRSYPVRYTIRNKSGKPLTVSIRGENDKNVRFDLERTVRVEGEAIVEGRFAVDPVEQEQNDWKTHPCVAAELVINGKSARFRIGILPEFPAKIVLAAPNGESYLDAPDECYLHVENRYKEPATFEFALPESDLVRFEQRHHRITLPAEGKHTVCLPCVVRQFGLFQAALDVRATLEDSGDSVTFTRRVHRIFKGQTGMFGGETDDRWAIVNGPYTVYLNKDDNSLWSHHFNGEHETWWMHPKIGRPYSPEFSKKKAEKVTVFRDDQAMVLKAEYDSGDFPRIRLVSVARLYANGLIERYFELENRSDRETDREIVIGEDFFHSMHRGVVPYEGDFIDLGGESYAGENNYWEADKVSENWLFSYGDKMTWGIAWDPSLKLARSEWHYGIEHPLGKIGAGQKVRTRSTFLAHGTFGDWFDFRSFALRRREAVRPDVSDHFELAANGRNPFVGKTYTIRIKERKKAHFDGQLTVSSQLGGFASWSRSFRAEDGVRETSLTVTSEAPAGTADVIRLDYRSGKVQCVREQAVFPVAGGPCRELVIGEAGAEVFCFDNGILSAKASPSFGNVVYSLEYEGREWLDSSYPEPGPKSWWNPWTGGIAAELQGISALSMLQEARTVQFASLTDNRGNEWRGIQIRVKIEQHEKYRGLELFQYYLMLPGAAVLCCVNQLVNRTGQALLNYHCSTQAYLKPDEALEPCWFRGSEPVLYRCGKVSSRVQSKGVVQFGSEHRKEKLLAVAHYPGTNASAFANNHVVKHGAGESLRLAHDAAAFTRPVFYAFDVKDLTYDQLRDLAGIRFEVQP